MDKVKFRTEAPFNIGDTVRVVKEPRFLLYYPGSPEKNKFADLSHLIGLEGVVSGYMPNMFDMMRGMKEGYDPEMGFWYVDFDPEPKNVPRGFWSEGFNIKDLEKI